MDLQVVQPCLSQTAGVVNDNEGIGEVMQKNVDLLQAFLKSLLMVTTSKPALPVRSITRSLSHDSSWFADTCHRARR